MPGPWTLKSNRTTAAFLLLAAVGLAMTAVMGTVLAVVFSGVPSLSLPAIWFATHTGVGLLFVGLVGAAIVARGGAATLLMLAAATTVGGAAWIVGLALLEPIHGIPDSVTKLGLPGAVGIVHGMTLLDRFARNVIAKPVGYPPNAPKPAWLILLTGVASLISIACVTGSPLLSVGAFVASIVVWLLVLAVRTTWAATCLFRQKRVEPGFARAVDADR